MKKTFYNFSKFALAVSCVLGVSLNVKNAYGQDYIAPPMVNIPAGQLTAGTNHGPDYATPTYSVEVSKFRMAKYSVTVAEFRLFAQATGFKPTAKCKDHIDERWLSPTKDEENTASWDNHRFLESEYQPVTCITWQEANAYADWLSKKTGYNYRLPTEHEWDYALSANTTSRYFWGDDPKLTQACKYGNFADQTGEFVPSEQYGASYVGFLGYLNCDDGEAYISIVGLYRPNPFGLYDMLGNVHHFNGSCYYDGHLARTEQEMDIEQCEYIAQSGNMWHAKPVTAAERGSYPRIGAKPLSTMGFRLAMDGHGDVDLASTTQFEEKLSLAQKERIETRPKLPKAPANLQLIKQTKTSYRLSWQPVADSRIAHYQIYRSTDANAHRLGRYYKKYYELIDTVDAKTNQLTVALPQGEGSFRIVSVADELTSLPSDAAVVKKESVVSIPNELRMEHATKLENLYINKSRQENDPYPYYLIKYDNGFSQQAAIARFKINAKKSGWYTLNYKGRSSQEGPFFTLWSGNKQLETVSYNKDIDDKTSNRHKVYLDKGYHELELNFVRPGWDIWTVTWLNLSESK